MRVLRRGLSRTDYVARVGTTPSLRHVFDICSTHPEGEGQPNLLSQGCRCSIVVSIPACHATDRSLILGNGAPLCFGPLVVIDVPTQCPRGSPSDPLPDAPLFCVPCARGRHAQTQLHVSGQLPPLATFSMFTARFQKERDHRSTRHEDVVVV